MATIVKNQAKEVRMGAALLRVALALRANPTADLSAVVRRTADSMGLDHRRLSRYLADNMTLLRRTAPAAAVVTSSKGRRR